MRQRARQGLLRAAVALAALAALDVLPARAEEPAAAPAKAAAPRDRDTTGKALRPAGPAAPGPAIRVRASHRVDVIGPGERVDSVIDRLRGPSAAPAGAAAPPLPVRGVDRREGPRPPDRLQGPGPSMPTPGSPAQSPPPRGDGPPPDRPRR